jgi:murein DD-endopeptidase MepM/ murein hydrolase activator NlpD
LVAVAIAVAMAGSIAPVHAQEPDPAATRRSTLSLAQERLDEARAFATTVAERMAAVKTQQGELAAEIAHAEAEIPQLRARAEALRELVRQRAVRLYLRGATPKLDAVVNTETVVDAARAAHLTEAIGEHDKSAAADLQATARELEERQGQLRAQRDELERTIASLAPLRELLDAKLAVASSAYTKVQDALAKRGDEPDVTTGAAHCPVKGFVVFTDDFGQPRDGGAAHEGIDMPSLEGTPLVAVVDGVMLQDESPAGGHGIWLYGVDEVGYYYAHLSRYEGTNRLVKAGDVIGYVGTTGASTGPHLHFEVHPQRGKAVDGFSLLLGLCAEETFTPRG